LSHICFEVLKNALRAVVERYGPGADSFPPIRILVAEGEEVQTPPRPPSPWANPIIPQTHRISLFPLNSCVVLANSGCRTSRSRLRMKEEESHGVSSPGYGHTCTPPPNPKTSTPTLINPISRRPWLGSDTDFRYRDCMRGTLVGIYVWRVWMDMGRMCI
jgi:hypothetical protein